MTFLMLIVLLLVIGAFPKWGYNSGWGYAPFGGLGLLLVILVVWFFFSGGGFHRFGF